jgi:hypothetical protein
MLSPPFFLSRRRKFDNIYFVLYIIIFTNMRISVMLTFSPSNCTHLKLLVVELSKTWPIQKKKTRLQEYGTFFLTLEFAIYIIFFADKSIFVHNIKFFSCRKLFSTDHTCETLKMKNFIPGATYEIIWWNTLRASGTFCSISSEIEK